MARRSLFAPILLAAIVVVVLVASYKLDVPIALQHAARSTPSPTPSPTATISPSTNVWPGTSRLTATLLSLSQNVMYVKAMAGTYGIVLARSTVVLPSCGRYPTFAAGERLEIRAPLSGNGLILATMVRPLGLCTPPP